MDHPTTLFQFFFDTGEIASQDLDEIESSDGLKTLRTGLKITTAGGFWEGPRKDVADSVKSMLDVSFDRVIAAAWNARNELHKLSAQSRSKQQEVFTYRSGKQKIHTDFEPKIEITLDDKPLKAIQFTAALDLEIEAVELQIRDGRITGIRAGTMVGVGSLRCGKQEIIKRKTRPLRLPGEFTVPEGLPIA